MKAGLLFVLALAVGAGVAQAEGGLDGLAVLLLSGVGVVGGADVPRHVDPGLYEFDGPDPEMLYMFYHGIYEGMILENMTIQGEWLDWAGDVDGLEDLSLLLEAYGDQLELQADNLNLTRYYLGEVIRHIGEYNLTTAQASFFKSLRYLEQSNETLPVLRGAPVRRDQAGVWLWACAGDDGETGQGEDGVCLPLF
ncbi:MAG: hypothetical protein KAX80_13485 [Planctomycetes bacterium]|nr:hypothetical protein [Planctomycetota bacterium]